ncbi:MAG: ErfK/YbiS/YcfS/YnhG family protein, partial [Berkelbacteria bacterium GW2011_GWA2_38_9]
GQVVNTFLISSGLPGMETPRGDFTLGRRVYSKLYSGPGFYLPNTLYNMNITGPYWLHGAYWHNSFGRKKSHGCVNVHYTNAAWLWDWTSNGTPISIQE